MKNDHAYRQAGKLKREIHFFESILLDFFRKVGREYLPWRKTGVTAYEVWVSEIMLQQTQVSRVLSYYEKFLARFPNVEILAEASWEEFLPYYAGLGYYARGRNMLRAAKMVVEKFGGELPRDVRELETLPGIGTYTAAAIASFAYDEEIIAWDTNLRRVVGRFFFGRKQADLQKFQAPSSNFQINFKSQNSKHKNGDKKFGSNPFSIHAKILNAALMDFGSALCMGKPKCGSCPLRERCAYFGEKGKQELEIKNAKLKMKNDTLRERINIWKEARVIVTVHENHRKYFSSVKESYQPFFLPASHNTRAGIKSWFHERYGLEVSVRPPHGKMVMKKTPILLVNAQILAGTHLFTEFSKEAALNSASFSL